MSDAQSVVYKRLKDDAAIAMVVGADVLPIFRDDKIPSLVYSLLIDTPAATYQATGPITYELTVNCIAETYADAKALSELVKTRLDFADWTDGDYRVLSCFYRDYDDELPEIGSKNRRIACINLYFDFIGTA
jgi:hypothetical protein